ncbi:MAG: pilus assembly protein PilP [Gammaproteobacteria bacterium]|nr:MAG: pilus assembly protein PilP [Gammaproteobacteria bacterium]
MSLADSLKNLNELDLSDLDLDINNAGSWPAPVKVIVCLIVFALVLAGFYWFDIKDLNERYARTQSEEPELKRQYEDKAYKVANIDAYRQQMEEMERSFGALLKQLPSDTEVPGLLEDISTSAAQSGLVLQSIDLRPEASKEFYVELPIDISVTGGYHEIATFVSSVAGLPRIVTLHDFAITRQQEGGLLAMQIQAKTYRYNGQGGKK